MCAEVFLVRGFEGRRSALLLHRSGRNNSEVARKTGKSPTAVQQALNKLRSRAREGQFTDFEKTWFGHDRPWRPYSPEPVLFPPTTEYRDHSESMVGHLVSRGQSLAQIRETFQDPGLVSCDCFVQADLWGRIESLPTRVMVLAELDRWIAEMRVSGMSEGRMVNVLHGAIHGKTLLGQRWKASRDACWNKLAEPRTSWARVLEEAQPAPGAAP